MSGRKALLEYVRANAVRLPGGRVDYDPLLDRIGDASLVLLGEATHGTHEFYRARAEITKRLIREKGFHAVAIEGDWPDAYRVNTYVRGMGEDADAEASLAGFKRFPVWMWRNSDVLDFVGWLRDHNERAHDDVGFYGLDLYSLYTSIDVVVRYLDRVDPEAAQRAKERYACFDHYGGDTRRYGYSANLGLSPSCETEVVEQLLDLRRRVAEWRNEDGKVLEENVFSIEQNARLIKNAEEYYRTMFMGASSWNRRDRHMAETLDAIRAHLERRVGAAKLVVWAHNSHVGDARATEMGRAGELNIGQLAREQYGTDAVLVGFTTYEGTVTAASDWDAPSERKAVRSALGESYESVFHEVGIPRFMLVLGEDASNDPAFSVPRIERAIGVVYRPKSERSSHYFGANLTAQFDVVVHFDHTRAVEPLERTPGWVTGEPPETYPFAV
ncbi:MAG: erythromycin esterase family protein [Polyangiaceae bacterium]|nr:erythromycin esterase family protein [Polyangiaceae bacterium]